MSLFEIPAQRIKPRVYALVGNPNCGKTTLFNALTGLRQKVGNYPGVTVERRTGVVYSQYGEALELIDLPGSYGLHPRSPDEAITTAALLGQQHARPEGIICVVDASNLERHLYLATQILELRLPTLIALNMVDNALNVGIEVNAQRLTRELGAQVIPCQATKPDCVIALKVALSQLHHKACPPWKPLGSDAFQKAVDRLAHCIEHDQSIEKSQAVHLAHWHLTQPKYKEWQQLSDLKDVVQRKTQKIKTFFKYNKKVPHVSDQTLDIPKQADTVVLQEPPQAQHPANNHYAEDAYETAHCLDCPQSITACIAQHQHHLYNTDPDWNENLVRERYGLIRAIVGKTVKQVDLTQPSVSERIDRVTLHPVGGPLALLSILGVLFYSLFFIAEIPKGWIEAGVEFLNTRVAQVIPSGQLQDLICEGVLAGVGAVLAFLPQILILMFFIGLLEATGYMTRAVFILDRWMQRVGLQGRSFIPLLSSYACAIPGILATRTIDSPKDRLATILVAPFASCSARLPIYAVMIATLVPAGPASATIKALLMLLMYLLGTAAAFGFAWMFKHTFLKGSTAIGVMELPPYRWPHLSYLLWDMWHRTKMFVTQAGTIILALSIVLWFTLSHPRLPGATPSEQIAHSYAGHVGQWIEPIIEPLGFDWKIGIGIISSFAAREVFISTLAIVYHIENTSHEDISGIEHALQKQVRLDGTPVFTPRTCLSLMIFYVFAMQCISTLAAVRRETGSWRWPLFQLIYMTVFAYFAAWIVYQAAGLLGFT